MWMGKCRKMRITKKVRGRKRKMPFFSLPAACRLFSRGVIFTPGSVSLALLSLRKNGGLLVVYMFIFRVTGADYSFTDKSVFTRILVSTNSNCHRAIARVIIPELILILAVKQAVKLNGLFTLKPIYPPLFNQSEALLRYG